MHKRKRMALLAGQADEIRQSRFISGFLRQAFFYDFDVCIFSMFRKYQSTTAREKGELNIFNLFEPSDFDGIVILKDSIQTGESSVSVEQRIKAEYDGPVLVIDRESKLFDCVFEDDYYGMSSVITHMIEKHGYYDIAFITGRKGHTHSTSRLQAYEDTMKAHGLPINENRIFYGDFWYISGCYAVKQFASGEEGMPRAIVCANDEMAIGVCSKLHEMGYKIPEDVAVAGFDSSNEGKFSPIPITSGILPYEDMGSYAATYIYEQLNGNIPERFNSKPLFSEGATCGCCCAHDLRDFDPTRSEWPTDRMNGMAFDNITMMKEDLMLQTSTAEYFGTLYSYLYQIRNIKKFSLCLAKPWKDIESDPGIHLKNNGYPSKMIRAISYDDVTGNGTVDMEDIFNTRDLLPDLDDEREEPAAFYFTPFFCEDECFGYSAISFGNEPISYDASYRRWIEDAARGFEMLRRTLITRSYKEYIENQKSNKLSTKYAPYDDLSAEQKKECDYVASILDNNLLTYVFQPIIKADTGEVFSYEALMRSKTKDPVSPLTIIKYAGIMGRLADIEHLTFRNILTKLEEDPSLFNEHKLFINSIPGLKIEDDKLQMMFELMQRNSNNIVVEFTEEAELTDADLHIYKNYLTKLGVQIAIDDFGTGYSNINNLLRYMPNYVKIDKSLLSGLENAPQKQHFVREIIKFCHDNKILSLAEGVETSEELRMVIHMGVDLIQGYYTAKPDPVPLYKIDNRIKNEIVLYSQEKDDGMQKQIYNAGSSNRISLALLSKYGCTDIIVGTEEAVYRNIHITGAPNLKTDIHIQVLSGYSGEITLENVCLSNIKGRPCIDIEEGCNVTLDLKGNNTFRGVGIKVSKYSVLKTSGDGNLTIECNDSSYYGIGNDLRSVHGDIIFGHNGKLTINGNGNEGICIGSGLGGKIDIASGQFYIKCGGTRCVGIGTDDAASRINIVNCNIEININANLGTGIGSLSSSGNVYITRSSVLVLGSGNIMSGIGSISNFESNVTIEDASVEVSVRSNESTCVGSLNGLTKLKTDNVGLRIENAGKKALAVGGIECDSEISLDSTDIRVNIHNSIGRDTYAKDGDISIINGRTKFTVNEQDIHRELKFLT